MQEDGEEGLAPRRLKSPLEPSQAEIEEHEAQAHAVYRNWCKICLASRGLGQQHLPAPPEDETAVPVIASDYAFMGQEDESTIPMIVIKDRRSKVGAASFVERKGENEYAIKFFAHFLRQLGYRRVIMKSDGEPALLLLKRRAVELVPALEAVPQESAPADHQANGEIAQAAA